MALLAGDLVSLGVFGRLLAPEVSLPSGRGGSARGMGCVFVLPRLAGRWVQKGTGREAGQTAGLARAGTGPDAAKLVCRP